MTIFNYGSINIDHIYRVPHLVAAGETLASSDYQTVLGGKGANQSIALAKAGANVIHIGRYHTQDQWVADTLAAAEVNTSSLQTTNIPTGHAIIQVDNKAENSIILFKGANHSFQANELTALLKNARPHDWLLLQNECSCIAEIIDLAIDKQLRIAFNPAPMTDAVKALPLDKLDLLIVNKIEAAQLLDWDSLNPEQEALVSALQTKFPDTTIVLTLGSSGALWIEQANVIYVPAFQVDAIDTTAAGDTFIGYLLASLEQKQTPQQALSAACKASALCVQTLGASISIPDATTVAQFTTETT